MELVEEIHRGCAAGESIQGLATRLSARTGAGTAAETRPVANGHQ